jgi:hypothetical protein
MQIIEELEKESAGKAGEPVENASGASDEK